MRRIGLATLVVFVALGGATARATLETCCGSFQQPGQLAISPDGGFAYVSSYERTLALRRNTATGALSLLDEYGGGGSVVDVSADGRFVYVSGSTAGMYATGYVDVFARDTKSGRLTRANGWRGRDVRDVVLSADGRRAYVTEGSPNAVVVLDRDEQTGKLATRQTIRNGLNGVRLVNPGGLTLSPDQRFLYASSLGDSGGNEGVSVFEVQTNGGLSYVNQLMCVCSPMDLQVTTDGTRVYMGPYEVGDWTRDPDSGKLSVAPDSGWRQEGYGPWVFDGALALTPDGQSIYGIHFYQHELYRLDRSDTGFELGHTYRDGTEGIRGADYPDGVTLSPDGGFLYLTAGNIPTQTEPGRVVVFRRDPATNDLTFASLFTGPPQPEQDVFEGGDVDINGDDTYTNDRDVTLSIEGLVPYTTKFVISNDSEFRKKRTHRWPWHPKGRYKWTLRKGGAGNKRRVWVRRHLSNGLTDVLTDEIVLDVRRPRIRVATRGADRRLVVRARDRVSGIGRVQVTRDLHHAGRWRRYRRHGSYAVGLGRVYVRVRDRAGNKSGWRTVD